MFRVLILLSLSISFNLSAKEIDLKIRLNKILKSYSVSQDQLGLAVIDLSSSEHDLLFSLNEAKDLIPASVTKIATASAVLSRLGPSYKFQTTLWSDAKIEDGVLRGNLILKGGGDCGFVSESMWFLVNEFTRTGIKKIEGDIIVDDSEFDSVRADTSRDPERVDRAYDAPVGAMSFNWNSINVFVRATQIGKKAEVYLDPIPVEFKVENSAVTVGGGASNIEVQRQSQKILVRGTIGVSQNEFVAYKNIDDPADWSGRNLVFFLGQRGISVSGKVKSGFKTGAAKLLAKAESKPVSQHVADMMKFSNNYVAEMLTKNLSVHAGKVPGNIESGMTLIRGHLNDLGIANSRFNLLNPSGLSRKNRLKAIDLATVLTRAQQNFPIFAEMLSSFPLAGQDGTLKNRMKSSPGWVRAKTGLLTGVVALAGYAGRKDGSTRAFAFIFNGKGEQGDLVRRLFDALALELVQ